MIYYNLNTLPKDSYFLRLKDNKNCFIHFECDCDDDETESIYVVQEGVEGAEIFTKEDAYEFIVKSGANNLELVKVISILPNDGTLN